MERGIIKGFQGKLFVLLLICFLMRFYSAFVLNNNVGFSYISYNSCSNFVFNNLGTEKMIIFLAGRSDRLCYQNLNNFFF